MKGDGFCEPGEGCDFDEDLADLIELNGYTVSRSARSVDGGSKLIATRDDEVGHKVTYVIHLKASGTVEEQDVEAAVKAQNRYPGSISVVVSPHSGFSRSASDIAERRGVRLWGEGEVDRLRRNVADKRGLRRREPARDSHPRGRMGRWSKAKLAGLLLVLAVVILYAKFYGFGADPPSSFFADLEDLVARSLRGLEAVWRFGSPLVRDGVTNVSERVLDALGRAEGLWG